MPSIPIKQTVPACPPRAESNGKIAINHRITGKWNDTSVECVLSVRSIHGTEQVSEVGEVKEQELKRTE